MTVHRASRDVRHIINVKDYGVTGNGSIDDYSRINDAITAIDSDERVLYFPAGAGLLEIDFHYELDIIGSLQTISKV